MPQNYYKDLSADFSRPGLVSQTEGDRLIREAEEFIAMKAEELPIIGPDLTPAIIEQENRPGGLLTVRPFDAVAGIFCVASIVKTSSIFARMAPFMV